MALTLSGQSNVRVRLLERVERAWIKGVLERSLYQEARLELGMDKTITAPHPWEAVSVCPDSEPEPVQPGTPLSIVFDQLDQATLILRAARKRKTTTMLELLRELLAQARADTNAVIPVFLPLASWALKQEPLAEWIQREVSERYQVPIRYVKAWLEAEQLAPLLDGLDEVAAGHREECVLAINTFRREHGTVPIAVCSRELDYQRLQTRLTLYGALIIQPLSRVEVERFLDRPDSLFADAQAALASEPGLWDLIDTPLVLSIMILAFRDPISPGVLSGATRKQRLERLFTIYVRTMLGHRRTGRQRPESVVRRLAFLAGQLQITEQTVYNPDLLSRLSLPLRRWEGLVEVVASLGWVIINSLSFGAIGAAYYGLGGGITGVCVGVLCGSEPHARTDSVTLAAHEASFALDEDSHLTDEILRTDLAFLDYQWMRFLRGSYIRIFPQRIGWRERQQWVGLVIRNFHCSARAVWTSLFAGFITVLFLTPIQNFLLVMTYGGITALAGITVVGFLPLLSEVIRYLPRRSLRWEFPSPGVRAALRLGVTVGIILSVVFGIMAGLLVALQTTPYNSVRFGTIVAACVALFTLGSVGGFALFEQTLIRLSAQLG